LSRPAPRRQRRAVTYTRGSTARSGSRVLARFTSSCAAPGVRHEAHRTLGVHAAPLRSGPRPPPLSFCAALCTSTCAHAPCASTPQCSRMRSHPASPTIPSIRRAARAPRDAHSVRASRPIHDRARAAPRQRQRHVPARCRVSHEYSPQCGRRPASGSATCQRGAECHTSRVAHEYSPSLVCTRERKSARIWLSRFCFSS